MSARRWPDPRLFFSELLAGLSGALVGAPQAMAFALIAGLSPIHGLYTAVVGTLVGALVVGHGVMTIAPTNALALVVGSTLRPFVDGQGGELAGLFALTALVGVWQLAGAGLRLGRWTRHFEPAVMIGFIAGAGTLIALNQLPGLLGLARGGEWWRRWGEVEAQTALSGVAALVLMLALGRTRAKRFAALLSISAISLAVAALTWREVPLVRDIASIPQQLPLLRWPDLQLWPQLWQAALAVALLGLLQSTALARSLPESRQNPERDEDTRDFLGQGLANLVGGALQCMPAGGSLSRTAVLLAAGGRTRWSNVVSALMMAALLLSLASVAERIALTALAAQLILAGLSLVDRRALAWVWRQGWAERGALLATLAVTMLLPLERSVFIGVAISVSLTGLRKLLLKRA